MKLVFNFLGIIGVLFILLAFFLLQQKKVNDDDNLYNLLNVLGGVFLGFYGAYYKAWFTALLNFIWAIIAFLDFLNM